MPAKIKIRATVNIIGLKAGQEAEVDLTDLVWDLLRSNLLLALRPSA